MKKTRVLLADDHALVRSGISVLVQRLEDFEVVGETGDGREALALIDKLRPDIVLMDISMPELNGLEAAAQLAKAFSGIRVIILSMHANEEYVLQALRAGAAGYLLKDAGPVELELALKVVAAGGTYLTPGISRHLVADYVRRAAGDSPAPLDRLTPRQREVLQLIAEGHSTKAIAGKLGLSVKTAETHRAQLMERLDIHDVAGLVRYAIRIGLIEPGS